MSVLRLHTSVRRIRINGSEFEKDSSPRMSREILPLETLYNNYRVQEGTTVLMSMDTMDMQLVNVFRVLVEGTEIACTNSHPRVPTFATKGIFVAKDLRPKHNINVETLQCIVLEDRMNQFLCQMGTTVAEAHLPRVRTYTYAEKEHTV